MMWHYFWNAGSLLAKAFLVAGILLVHYGLTHSTATRSLVIFAGSMLAVSGITLLGLLWEPAKSARALRRHGWRFRVP
jgi:hypothetical protein